MYMTLLVVANDVQKEELLQNAASKDVYIEWISEPGAAANYRNAAACIDLLFENTEERVQWLKQLPVSLIIVNSVITTLAEIREDFVRINGWNTFLKRPVAEAACNNDSLKEKAAEAFAATGKKTEWVPDIPGFITARVVASVINEAYFTLQEKVSSKEEIDTAMKLGTNYPYGPFEWSEKIGLQQIYDLLHQMAGEQKRYVPAALLTKEATG
jgi:3-hydroxybutyryl-CoA dehydrogenase